MRKNKKVFFDFVWRGWLLRSARVCKKVGELDIVDGEELLGVRAAIFVGLHINDLGRQIAPGVCIADQRLIEIFLGNIYGHMNRVLLAALIAQNVNVVIRHANESIPQTKRNLTSPSNVKDRSACKFSTP